MSEHYPPEICEVCGTRKQPSATFHLGFGRRCPKRCDYSALEWRMASTSIDLWLLKEAIPVLERTAVRRKYRNEREVMLVGYAFNAFGVAHGEALLKDLEFEKTTILEWVLRVTKGVPDRNPP